MGKTINELLETLNVPTGTEKTASATGAAPAPAMMKQASLQEVYSQTFGAAPSEGFVGGGDVEKQAAIQKEAEAAHMEKVGEIAGEAFAQELTLSLMKVAAADSPSPDAAASKDTAGNPKLPVNRPADADKKIDLTPDQYDIASLAMSKAEIERKLEDPAKIEGPVLRNVDTGLATPTSQKTASASLTKQEMAILQLNIPEGLMKEARAKVAQVAELEKVASACLNYGVELALEKIAEMEDEAAEKKKKHEAGETPAEERKEEEEEAVKEAQAMGRFITEGYLRTMLEKSAETYSGDASVYVNQLIKEAGIKDIVHKIKGVFSRGGKAAKETAKKAGNLK